MSSEMPSHDCFQMYSTETIPMNDIEPNQLKLSQITTVRKIQSSSFFDYKKRNEIELIKPLLSCRVEEMESILVQKLRICRILFDFNDITCDLIGKEVKRQSLKEIDSFTLEPIFDYHTENIYRYYFKMFSANMFRSFPEYSDFEISTEDPEVLYECTWPHLSIVYDIFLKFFQSPKINTKLASIFLTNGFLYQFIDLFDSRDKRERNSLLEILFIIYVKIFEKRNQIRQYISYIFYRQVNENLNFHGIKELLELQCSIIQGLNTPIKKEHLIFLYRYLMPLHLDKFLHHYSVHLKKSIVHYITKDFSIAEKVINYLIKKFPKTPNINRILVMDEIEHILKLIPQSDVKNIIKTLLNFISPLMSDTHYQTAERALFLSRFLFNGYNMFKLDIFAAHAEIIKNIKETHWCFHIRKCAETLLKIFEYDLNNFS